MKNQKYEQLAVIMSIVERGSGTKLTNLYTKHQVFTHLRCEGRGTATSEIMDILGLGSSEKDIVLSIAPVSAARALLTALNEELRGSIPGRGIAFSAKLAAVSNLAAAVINTRTKLEKESGEMEQKQKSSLILTIVNQGFTDIVMDTAKKAGARGGTIIRSRWVGEESFEQFYGIFGRLACGTIFDKIGSISTARLLSTSSLLIVGLLYLAYQMKSVPLMIGLMCAALIFFGGNASTIPSITRGLYGDEHFSSNFSVVYLNSLFSSIPTSIVGMLQASDGSYAKMFYLMGGCAVIATVCAWTSGFVRKK